MVGGPLVVLVLVVASAHVNAAVDENLTREIRSLLTTQDEYPGIASLILDCLNNVEPILTFVKTQIKDILVDIYMEIWGLVKQFLRIYKIKLFNKIGKYTIGDVVRCLFDGVAEFVNEDGQKPTEPPKVESPKEVIKGEKEYDILQSQSELEPNYFMNDPYMISTLIRQKKTVR